MPEREDAPLLTLGFAYSRTKDSLVGVDPERLELGEQRATIGRDGIVAAKTQLMDALCSGLTAEQKTRRVSREV